MSEEPDLRTATRLLRGLWYHEEFRVRTVPGAELDARVMLIRRWQSQRLARTYADLLASRRYGPACRFVLSDLYAPRDFGQRDRDIEVMYHYLLQFLPSELLRTVAAAIELNTLTQQLDLALSGALAEGAGGAAGALADAEAIDALLRCQDRPGRRRQVELIVEIGRDIDAAVHLPMMGVALRIARVPARRAGWHELHDFLERGFHAFRHMHGARHFIETIRRRETAALERLDAGDRDPFRAEGS